jgi:hypothetical protein
MLSEHTTSYVDPVQGPNIGFIITIVILLLLIVVLCIGFVYRRKPTTEVKPTDNTFTTLGTSVDVSTISRAYESARLSFFNWVGKTILRMNMRGDAIVYNYPFEKGFVEKLFLGVTAPQR